MKTRITTYTFDASAKTITFSGPLDIEGFQLIMNVVDNIIIYNFADATKGGTFSTNTLTLTYDTSSMSDTDELMILYEDGVNTQTVNGSVTANAGTNLNTSALALETGGNLAAIKTNTDDIETLLTTIEGNQLPDGHNVTIDNVSLDVDTGLTQPLTNTELRATPVPVSGTVTANTGLSQPLTDTQLRATAVPVSLASVPSHNVTNAGTFAVQATLAAETSKVIGTVRVASGGIASGALASGSIATGAIEDAKADDSAFTPATSRVFPVGAMADETSTDSVNEGDVGVPRMTLDRKQIVSVYPSATGEGLDIFRSIDLDETEEDVKTSAGKLFGWFIHNKNAATLYLKFYNATAANTTVGTTTPILTIPVPSGASANVEYTNGIAFSTALCAAVTTGVADNDTGAPGTNDFIANIFYK